MKIYILPIEKTYQPKNALFCYPSHNRDYGVEQDFLEFLLRQSHLITDSPQRADWHYLPVFWTRWHLNHNYGQEGKLGLQEAVDRYLLKKEKTFTICQYDDGPLVDLGATTVFLASRKPLQGLDIPLLCSPHRKPFFRPNKFYLASFLGRLSTHSLRQRMAEVVRGRPDFFLLDADHGPKVFVRKTLESFVALCPRGYGGSSFRFFEAMQLGVVPFLISDVDTRPFKLNLPWEDISLFAESPDDIPRILATHSRENLVLMGQRAAQVWKTQLTYQRWCPHVLPELQRLAG